jgi:antitoxin component YwqK of YwqJK toxin-antitoxin module
MGKKMVLEFGGMTMEQKKFEEYRQRRIKVGLWTQWYKSGKKKSERHYKDGKAHGRWTSWSEDGKITY